MTIPKKHNKIMRMNNNTRYTMRNKAVDLKYHKREEVLRKRVSNIVLEIYQELYKEYIPTMVLLPETAFNWKRNLYVKFYEDRSEAKFQYGIYEISKNITLPFEVPIFDIETLHVQSCSPSLRKKARAWLKDYVIFTRERGKYSRNVFKFLTNCPSCKKMLEVKPEAWDWIPEKESCTDTPLADLACQIK